MSEEFKTFTNVCSHCGNQFDWFEEEAFCSECVESFEAFEADDDNIALCEHCETPFSADGKFCSEECEQAEAFVSEQESKYQTYKCRVCNVPYLSDDGSDGVHCSSCAFNQVPVQTAPV